MAPTPAKKSAAKKPAAAPRPAAKHAASQFRTKPRFKLGSSVHVSERSASGHCRTPWYLRGKSGVVVAVQGTFHDPERLAYHRPGLPEQILYKVRFRQSDLWARYSGLATDHLEADIYEYWLASPEEATR